MVWKAKKMNPEIKAKWVAALRSGDYTQGIGALRSKKNEFCCLGVLCNIHAKDTGVRYESKVVRGCIPYLNMDTALPDDVIIWSGLERNYGSLVTIDKSLNTLAFHNDSGKTFEQIADAIEKQL
jgi:hypothetical protein